ALAIEIEIADVEGTACDSLFRRIVGVKGAGETVFGVIDHAQSLFKTGNLDDGQHGTENFFLGYNCVGRDVCEDGRFKKVAAVAGLRRAAASDQSAFLLASLDIAQHGVERGLVDDGSKIG